jgi:hypothetical protein
MQKNQAVILMLLVASIAACSADPATAKRRFLAEGDQSMAEKKCSEAIVHYRNALRQEDRFGEARLKLTGAYSDWRQVLKLNPKFPAADEVRRTLATIQGERMRTS